MLKLEKEFRLGSYLCRTRRIDIATGLGLTEKQIKVWFQNRRMKFKKDSKTESNDQLTTESALHSQRISIYRAPNTRIFTTTSDPQSSALIVRDNTVQNATPDLSRVYLRNVLQNIPQNVITTSHYNIVDQPLEQPSQNYLSSQTSTNYTAPIVTEQSQTTNSKYTPPIVTEQSQTAYNVSSDHTSYSQQEQQHFYPHQEQVDYSAIHHPQWQQNNYLIRQHWNQEDMQGTSDAYSYAQTQDEYINANTNNVSNQMPDPILRNDDNNYFNNISCLSDLSFLLMENSSEQPLINENATQLTNPAAAQINSDFLHLKNL